jgi:hypothetical protein
MTGKGTSLFTGAATMLSAWREGVRKSDAANRSAGELLLSIIPVAADVRRLTILGLKARDVIARAEASSERRPGKHVNPRISKG